MTTGYDNLRVNQAMLLDLQLREGTGTAIADWAKGYRAKLTATGAPTWAFLGSDLAHLSFNSATPDYLVSAAAAATDLDFTSGAFSGAMWIAPDAYGNRYLMDHSTAATGWAFYLAAAAPYLRLYTFNAGPASQYTDGAASLALSAWQLIGFTRSGAGARIYLNGKDVTATPGTHINPASAAATDFTIGINSAAAAGFYDGLLWRPRVWGRALAAWEMLALYEGERDQFGV